MKNFGFVSKKKWQEKLQKYITIMRTHRVQRSSLSEIVKYRAL